MRNRRHFAGLATAIAIAAAPLAVLTPAAVPATAAAGPVVVIKDPVIGQILATRGHRALYTWNQEKPGKVRCTGACEKAWPALTVRKRSAVRRHVAGVMGTFGTIKRPDGRLQVTFNRRPVYTFAGDPRGRAKCDNVDGWFAVRAS